MKVIVDDAAKNPVPIDYPCLHWIGARNRGLLLKPLMWSSSVVVCQIFVQYPTQVRFIHNQEVIEAFLTNRAHPALRVSVRIRCLDWCRNDVDLLGLENSIKCLCVLLVIVPNEAEKTRICFFEFPDELSCLLGYPETIWVACDPSQMDSSRA